MTDEKNRVTASALTVDEHAAWMACDWLLTRIGSWTNARWDQHLRDRYGDEKADRIIALLGYDLAPAGEAPQPGVELRRASALPFGPEDDQRHADYRAGQASQKEIHLASQTELIQRYEAELDRLGKHYRDRLAAPGPATGSAQSDLVAELSAHERVPADVHESGWQWRPVSEDTAFAPPFGTIRMCIACGCLVAGGPTRCARCADRASDCASLEQTSESGDVATKPSDADTATSPRAEAPKSPGFSSTDSSSLADDERVAVILAPGGLQEQRVRRMLADVRRETIDQVKACLDAGIPFGSSDSGRLDQK